MKNKGTVIKTTDTVYCHFSFKRPKDKPGYGYFAVVFYWYPTSKKPTAQRTVMMPLWKDHQFVTAIQSYEFALSMIAEWQGLMKSNGVTQVMLVTDNSTLAGWIEEPTKNKAYKDYMQKATEKYKAGAIREIVLGVGLCEAVDYEKSYKYCKAEYIKENEKEVRNINKSGQHLLDVSNLKGQYRTALDIAGKEEDDYTPKLV